MFALLAYSFITLFAGVAVLGHVLLFRDIFASGPAGNVAPKQLPDYRGMREAA